MTGGLTPNRKLPCLRYRCIPSLSRRAGGESIRGVTTLRIGLLGLGIHGRRYAHHLLAGDVPGLELARCWTRTDETARAVLGDRRVDRALEPEAMLEADDLDALVVALPTGIGFPLVEAALGAGRTVLAEKPLAVTRSDADRLLAVGGRLCVAHTLRFDPLLRTLAAEVCSGRLGRPLGFSFHQRLEPRPTAWEKDPTLARGGVVAQSAVHALDGLRFVLGEPELRVERSLLRHVHGHCTEDQAELLLSAALPTGWVAGSVAASKVGRSRHHRYAVFLDEGGVEADFIDRALWITEGQKRRALEVPAVPTLPALLGAFGSFVRGEADNPVPAELGRATACLIEEAYRQSGQGSGPAALP
jgi:predicted dehydrogenase